ncbi:aldo/keto reductase [Euzebya tangerina]|uniref:aldo/keto reductase n=1 Tax=Euzebya tangerina TaxID=591198 RepID=UPI000E31B3AC|nr:aldo/keto reductase [Euzebya tangerina]
MTTEQTSNQPTRRLGRNGPTVAPIGFGAMVLIDGMYGPVDADAAVQQVQLAADLGAMIDTADAYADNEDVIGRALADRSDSFVATKFGYTTPDDPNATRLEHNWAHELFANGRPDRVREAAETSLRRLGRDVLDLWYLHIPDPAVPISETVGAMADLVDAGLVRHLGVSNVTPDQLVEAAAAGPVAVLQTEWSLWARDAEADLIPTARQLGIGIVPWSPLGAGFLAGDVSAETAGADFRANNPRFSDESLTANRDRFAPLRAIADREGLHPAQLALAWLVAQGEDVVPIPGTRSPDHLRSNLQAGKVQLSPDTVAEINQAAAPGTALGATLLG